MLSWRALALCTLLIVISSSGIISQEVSRRDAVQFLNDFIKSVSNFVVSRVPCGGDTWIKSDFSLNDQGQMRLEEYMEIDCTGHPIRKTIIRTVNLKDLDPSPKGFGLSENPGFGYFDLMLICTNRVECGTYKTIRGRNEATEYKSDTFYIPVQDK